MVIRTFHNHLPMLLLSAHHKTYPARVEHLYRLYSVYNIYSTKVRFYYVVYITIVE
jgi:hypothetical protein